jgi:hypothetical protein
MSGTAIPSIPAPVTADPNFWRQGVENLNALRDQQAKQASADAYRQAIRPDGSMDVPKYNALIASGPGAWNAGPLMQQAGQVQTAQGQGAQEQLTAHRSRMAFMLGQMNDLLAKGQPIGAGDIATALNNAHFSPSEAAQVTQAVNSASGGNPNFDYTGFVKNQVTANLSAQEQIDRITPKITFVSTPQGLVAQDTNPNTTKTPPGSALPYGLSPGTKYWDPKGGPDGTGAWVLSGGIVAPGTVIPPGSGGAPGLNAAGDSATRKAAEGGPPAPNTPAAAVAQRTHDFWISQGYSEPVVAGILAGGPGSESDFSPTAKGDGGTSYGLYQHHGDRLAAMQKYFGLSAGQMPTEQQQNQYAAWEISPQGPLAAVGAALKAAKTPAEAATIWTRDFGVPGDKSEILRRANGAQRFAGLYGGQPQGQPPAAPTAPPAAPAGPPGVQMGGAPPPPPGGAQGPYTGGGIGAALSPVAPNTGGPQYTVQPPPNIRAQPIPAGRVVGSNVPSNLAAIQAGMQLARANPLQMGSSSTMVAGPGAPTGNNALQPPSVEPPPQAGWGSVVGTYAGGSAPAAAPVARPVAPPPVAPVAAPARPPAAAPSGPLMAEPPLGTGERVKADIDAYTKDTASVATHQGNVNTLQNAYRALQLADTGPGTQNLQAARAFLQSFGIATSATGDQATQWAEAHKYLMDYARTQGLMGGTDLQAQLAQGSNASTDIPKPAALAVVRNNIAKERMAMAQVQEASGSTGYVDHTKTFLPSQDLRAYQADIMPPQELKQIEALQKTNPKAFAKFQRSLDIARAHGLISDEDLAAQNQRIRALGP